jgi:RNA recognition motif-containing protein
VIDSVRKWENSIFHPLHSVWLTNPLQAKYGFVAFSDPEDFLKAWKEMDGAWYHSLCLLISYVLSLIGKYVGNRPVKLRKADSTVRPVEIGHRKAKQLDKERKGKGRPKPY